MEKDDETISDIVKTLDDHLGGKSHMVGLSNAEDIQKIKALSNLNIKRPHELLNNGLDGLEISEN